MCALDQTCVARRRTWPDCGRVPKTLGHNEGWGSYCVASRNRRKAEIEPGPEPFDNLVCAQSVRGPSANVYA